MVLYGDHPHVSAETIRRLWDTHREAGDAVITMGTALLPDFEEWRAGFYDFGRIVRDEAGSIQRIVEKKDATEEELALLEVNPSYLCFSAEWLWKTIHRIKPNNTQGEYYLTDLIGMAIEEGKKIQTVPVPPYEALGANTMEQLMVLEGLIEDQKIALLN
jgi:bifunctional UDP-N-acetylglucosamine pyrophosphorylase/glucosamine-1-phosphate N-acetyltransferase